MEGNRTARAQRSLMVMMIVIACITACQSSVTPTQTAPAALARQTSQPDGSTKTASIPAGDLTPESDPLPMTTQTPNPVLADSSWVKVYGGSQDSIGSDLIQASDGGVLIVGGIGEIFDDERSGGVLLLKTDEAGRVLWRKVYGGQDFDIGWSILQTRDGELMIAGQTASMGAGGMDAYLIKVDQQGKELWSHSYGTALDEETSIVLECPDGGFFLIGNQVDPNDFIVDPGQAGYGGFGGRSNPYIVRTDAGGNEIWSRTLESEENVIASAGRATDDSNLVLLATILRYPDFGDDAVLIKIDKNGDELWSRTWTKDAYAGHTFTDTSDGNLVLTGVFETEDHPVSDLYLIKVDLDGHELWRRHYGDPAAFESGQAILETQDGDLLLLASRTESLYSGRSGILLVKTDGSGKVLWEQNIDLFQSSKAHAILEHRDGGYLITGSTSGYDGAPWTFLLKTDREGNVPGEIQSIPFP